MNRTGYIVQVSGPVVDVVFPEGNLPFLKEALCVEFDGKKLMLETAQHIGDNLVRCITLGPSEGLYRDAVVTATGSGLMVPVGEAILGRVFNALGEPLDGGEEFPADGVRRSIHREPPSLEEQSPVAEVLETGIKVIDLLAPYAKGGKIGLFGGAGVGKTVLIQ